MPMPLRSDPPRTRTPSPRFRASDDISIRLADGRSWSFSGPAGVQAAGPEARRAVEGLVAMIRDSEDESERGRAELALAIRLLALNHPLGPEDYRRLLGHPSGSPEALELRDAFRALAEVHEAAISGHRFHEKPEVFRGVRTLRLLDRILPRASSRRIS